MDIFNNQKGFSLIEAIIVIIVISIGAIGVLSVFITGMKGAGEPMLNLQAVELAQEAMEQRVIGLRMSSGFNAVQDVAATTFSAPFTNFLYSVDITCVDANFGNAQGGTGYNANGSCDQTVARNYKQAVVIVTWPLGSISTTTVLARY